MKILVVGGGVMGLTCAWRLAQAGAAVELFDARRVGHGATLAALGALWPSSPLVNNPLQDLHRQSLWQFESFAADLAKRSDIPTFYRRLGRLELLNSEKAAARAKEEADHANRHWPDFAAPLPTMEFLTSAQVTQQNPAIVSAPHGALLCRATAQVLVPALVAALRHLCLASKVILRENTPVLSLDLPGNTVHTAAGAHAADALLITAGAWTPQLSPVIAQAAPVRPIKGQGLALRPPPGIHLTTILKSGATYLVPWMHPNHPDANEIFVGSTTEAAGYDQIPTSAARESLLASATALFPALKQATLLRHWTGLRPQNPHKPHPPIMGPHPSRPTTYLCTAHYKTGIGLAPLVSSLMTRCILERTTPPELKPFIPLIHV